MTNLAYAAISSVLFFSFAGFILVLLRKRGDYPGSDFLICAYAALMVWLAGYVLYAFEPGMRAAVIWYMSKYAAKGAACLFLLLFAVRFTNPFYNMRASLLFFLCFIPVVTAVLAFTNEYHGLLFSSANIVRLLPYKDMELKRSVWFYVQFIYNLICLIIPVMTFINYYRLTPMVYKWKIFIMTGAYIGIMCFEAIDLTAFFHGFQPDIIGYGLAGCLTFWALVFYNASDLVMLAKDAVFEKLSCVALILENDGRIMDQNPRAAEVFSFLGRKAEGLFYDDVMKKWVREKGGVISENEEGKLIAVTEESKRCYYQIIQSEILDRKKKKVGSFVEMRDVTTQQELITELFRLANYDQLTQLYNRRYFDKMCQEYDKPEYLPLTFIAGDVNGLKTVNDTYGHEAGDRLIVLAGEILKAQAPENAVVCRHGGDEFFVLIPNFNKRQAKAYIRRVLQSCGEAYEEPFGSPTISLGCAVKKEVDEQMGKILLKADSLMYRMKKGSGSAREDARLYHH